MAFTNFTRLVLSGHLRSTQTWSVGLSTLQVAPASSADLVTWLGTITAATSTFMTSCAGVVWDGTTTWNKLQAYTYDASAGPSAAFASLTTTQVAGALANEMPAQTSIVLSLRSGSHGRAGRGRMYLPLTGQVTAGLTNGQVSAATCTALANALKTYVDALNATSIGGGAVLIGIAGRASGFTVGATTGIVDSKPDTQRRRTDKIASANQTTVIF